MKARLVKGKVKEERAWHRLERRQRRQKEVETDKPNK